MASGEPRQQKYAPWGQNLNGFTRILRDFLFQKHILFEKFSKYCIVAIIQLVTWGVKKIKVIHEIPDQQDAENFSFLASETKKFCSLKNIAAC